MIAIPLGLPAAARSARFYILLKNMRTLTNVVCTPHVASRTYESVVRQATCAVKNLILALNGEKPIAQVNPEVGYYTTANSRQIQPKS
jgi:phosphoglycerate dehydrogenase-like enzyme